MKTLKNEFQNFKIDLRFRLFQLKLESVVYIPCIIYSIIINRFVSAIILFVTFLFLRPETPTTFHFDNVKTCIKTSFKMFVGVITMLLLVPPNVSLCLGLILGLYIVIELYHIKYGLTSDFNLQNCTAEQLQERCKEKGLDDVECKIAYYVVIERLKGEELADTIGYSLVQTKRKRKKIMDLIK